MDLGFVAHSELTEMALMAWERRNRNGRYYYWAKREGKSVRKIYVGKGSKARQLARQVEQRKATRAWERQTLQRWQADLWPATSRLQMIREACRQAYHATHYAAGYRLSRSYNWRPWRVEVKVTDGQQLMDSGSSEVGRPLPKTIDATLQQLKAGRRELLPHLRWQLSQVPALWRHCGHLGRLTQAAWARAIAGDDDLLRESIMLTSDEDRETLVGEQATPAERLLAERVVLSRMQLAYFEQLEGQNCHAAGWHAAGGIRGPADEIG